MGLEVRWGFKGVYRVCEGVGRGLDVGYSNVTRPFTLNISGETRSR